MLASPIRNGVARSVFLPSKDIVEIQGHLMSFLEVLCFVSSRIGALKFIEAVSLPIVAAKWRTVRGLSSHLSVFVALTFIGVLSLPIVGRQELIFFRMEPPFPFFPSSCAPPCIRRVSARM